jgi:hypothetical protein
MDAPRLEAPGWCRALLNDANTVTWVKVFAATFCGIRTSPRERDASYPARLAGSRLLKSVQAFPAQTQ